MLNQIVAVTLRLLTFRAGPQDFPYTPQLVAPMPALTVSAYFLFWSRLLPPGGAVAIALAGVGALALVTYSLLSARGVANRFQQTYHSLLAGTSVLTLLLVPPAIVLAPAMQQILADPELLNTPERVQMPAAASWMVNVIQLWAFALYAHVFRHATDARLLVGVLIAVFAVASVSLLTVVAAALLAPLVS
jgi:hypothetical protein